MILKTAAKLNSLGYKITDIVRLTNTELPRNTF